jgi:hypothetical protein
MWWSKMPQRRLRRLAFCGTRAANGGEAHTVLLCEVGAHYIFINNTCKEEVKNEVRRHFT